MRFSLRQLQVFLATAHHLNISKAAASLSMSQSAASSSLADLESQFDIQLFDRIGKRLQLNALGYSLRPQAEALLQQAEAFQQALQNNTNAGRLKIGATLTIGNYLAVHIMEKFLSENPGSKVELDVANTSMVAEKVRNFELDIGLIEGELQDSELEVSGWMEDELVAFCSPLHPLAGKGKLSDKHILENHWIVRETGSGTRQTFDWAMHGLLPELHIELELQHTEAIKRAVEANLGVGCLSKVALQDAFKRGSLVPLKIPHRDFKRSFYFIIHKSKYRSPAIESWLQCCRLLYS